MMLRLVMLCLCLSGTTMLHAEDASYKRWSIDLQIGQDFQLESYSHEYTSNVSSRAYSLRAVPVVSVRRFLNPGTALVAEFGGWLNDKDLDGDTFVFADDDTRMDASDDLERLLSLAVSMQRIHHGEHLLLTIGGGLFGTWRSIRQERAQDYSDREFASSLSRFERRIGAHLGFGLEWPVLQQLHLVAGYQVQAGRIQDTENSFYQYTIFEDGSVNGQVSRSESSGWYLDPVSFRFGVSILFGS